MTKYVLLLAGLTLAGTYDAAAQVKRPAPRPAARPVAKAPAAAAAPVQLVDLDLTTSGLPVLITVPAGTKIEVDKENAYSVTLLAPGFGLTLGRFPMEDGADAASGVAISKKPYTGQAPTTMLVEDKLFYRKRYNNGKMYDKFEVGLDDPANQAYYLVMPNPPESMFDTYTTAQSDRMFAAAKTMRLVSASK